MSELRAGRELDTLIATKVMGWTWYDGRGTAGPSYWQDATGKPMIVDEWGEWEPSTNLAHAWMALDKAHESMTRGSIVIRKEMNGRITVCNSLSARGAGDKLNEIYVKFLVSASTIQEALCLAALKITEGISTRPLTELRDE